METFWADLWYGPDAIHHRQALPATKKVATHQMDKGIWAAPGSEAHRLAVGNDWADSEAKLARRAEHPNWSRIEEKDSTDSCTMPK